MAIRRSSELSLDLRVERFPYHQPFRISGHVFTETALLVAELSDGEHVGRGEGAGVYYLGDDIEHMLGQATSVRGAIERGATREDLQHLLPPGGARNALDCAFWELEARQTGQPVWRLAGLDAPRALRSTLTLGADTPERMAAAAQAIDVQAPVKVKLTGDLADDVARIEAIRAARPDAWIGVDANQGYDVGTLRDLLPVLLAAGVAQLEQPLGRGCEADLDGLKRPLPFVADESALSLADTASLVGRFDMVNIKLDKCGGLTEGLAIARQAKTLGLDVMVGNMMGTSLSMAPSCLVGQLCDIVDLDGPTFLARDRVPGVQYRDGMIHCPAEVWGG
ncbi:dipeptide epimerase [Sphingopyxis alaskensis]|jgi:L-Ala-D/L-Glu epimerase|uniref:Dipeptide epimerase n=1 Tax=Sphingopyxis alaskensis (strain DSM 13593 / LMG 18877 / RB2256) TaxID=317655 RepID=Q1GT45_SPHAL|nr:dipeptide epimerase [Sphingopyxis alaskensis]ABF53177.1 mandelate racemase/muconate lactonizing enzyme [Sphingopyxis alaskensis RB2256]MCM3418596.1 dipeptide epimerase [Sphingopyxis alaskensis]